jgi:hypothetical protein
VQYKTIVEKWKHSRPCAEDNFNRDELLAILTHLGEYFPGKKADYLFFNTNKDRNLGIDADEFTDMWMKEQELKERRRRLLTDYFIKIQNRGRGICTCLAYLFRPSQ